MAAANTDKFMKVGKSTATTLSSPGYTVGNTSVNVASTTNWPTDTGVMFAIDETDADGARVSGTYNVFRGTVASGTQIDNLVYVGGDTNRNYSAGATTRVYILVSADRDNRLVDGILVEHNQDGTHGDITATSVTTDSLTITGSSDAEGWSALGNTLTYSSNDGNKQATYTITGVDKTDTIQEGMKVKLPRPTTVGTQCTDLEASSSQYASKTSPSGITFTDDFTCGAWVKVESLGASNEERTILSRYDYSTSSGFLFRVEDTTLGGAISLTGGNGSNTGNIYSYQGLTIGKWVHVAIATNFSTGTHGVYINGVSVDYTTSGTAITSIAQGGALKIGAFDAAPHVDFMDGKIKHAFVADKVLSATEVKEAMVSDDLTSASFSANLDAYFKLEGDFTDSSANGNDLTASGGAVATDTDSPFSSTEYGIITSASFSTDTTVTVFTGDGVAPNENITAPSYSTHRVPYGFPASRDKWKIEITRPLDGSTIAGGSTIFSTLLPVGDWDIYWSLGVSVSANVSHSSRTSFELYDGTSVLEYSTGGHNMQLTTGGTSNRLDTKHSAETPYNTTTTKTLSLRNNIYSGTQTFRSDNDYGNNVLRIVTNYL